MSREADRAMGFPDHPFQDFHLAVYGAEGVASR